VLVLVLVLVLVRLGGEASVPYVPGV